MESGQGVASTAALLGEPARATMLWTLLDGRARPAGELAFAANISAQSASNHLARLLEAGLLSVETQGRHRYYRLAGPHVASALESLAALAPRPAPRRLPASRGTPESLRQARTCYDHLAGELSVALLRALQEQGLLRLRDKDYLLTAEGEAAFARFGLDLAALRATRRRFACACLDWSEREFHLGGALGAGLLQELLRRRWLLRNPGSRVLQLTPAGRAGLRDGFRLAV
ncbi:MAG TPA: metalloregulator ArsR/SmtB family transcription factor [Noviherbaspirillum sp.]|jgi:DNA-binding transcriptional ArsR family regulator|uniref:ArsR/SmtB family transcription factor n=1 Tax=Noviherbaspirillum sp. TaxID=1926288 RepID=UPI002F91FCD9